MIIKLVKKDITKLSVEAIVNSAKPSLLGGGGVDFSIHKAAGPNLLLECVQLNGCAVGKAKITKGYNLNAKYVIHTVGPVWQDGNHEEDNLLESCYQEIIKLTNSHEIKSIAIPCISTGVYMFPPERAANIAINTILEMKNYFSYPKECIFCCYLEQDYYIYQEILRKKLKNL